MLSFIMVILKSQQLKIQPSSEWIRIEGHHKMILVKSGVVQYNDLIWKNNAKNKIKKRWKKEKEKGIFHFYQDDLFTLYRIYQKAGKKF